MQWTHITEVMVTAVARVTLRLSTCRRSPAVRCNRPQILCTRFICTDLKRRMTLHQPTRWPWVIWPTNITLVCTLFDFNWNELINNCYRCYNSCVSTTYVVIYTKMVVTASQSSYIPSSRYKIKDGRQINAVVFVIIHSGDSGNNNVTCVQTCRRPAVRNTVVGNSWQQCMILFSES